MSPTNDFDLRAASYVASSQRGLWGRLKRREVRVVTEELSDLRDARVLDLGCGPGIHALALKDRNPKLSFVGVDSSAAMILEYEKKGFRGHVQKIEELSLGERDFDVVLALGVMEFIESFDKLIERLSMNAPKAERIVLLVPRVAPASMIYFAAHVFRGNRIFLRRTSRYVSSMESNGYELVRRCSPTPISDVLVFRRRT